jgi:hypothetical protein
MGCAVGFWGWCAYQRWRRARGEQGDAVVDETAPTSS